MNFKCLKHTKIDAEKWNQCINTALNSRIYAYTWHLDRTAVKWDALVWGDYEYVMPLPLGKKLGIKYLYQPAYSQQLGIFPSPPTKVSEAFYEYIYANFRFSDVQLNSENLSRTNESKIVFNVRKNFLLPLSKSYEQLCTGFSTNTKRNITKGQKYKLNMVTGIRLEEYLEFKARATPAEITPKNLVVLKTLIAFGLRKGFGKLYGVYTANNELCAAAYFCKHKERLIYFNAATNETGKKLGGMFFLLNALIEQNAEKNIILDFEGSIIPGIARFFAGFGAKAENYYQLNFNRLPLLLKWYKQ